MSSNRLLYIVGALVVTGALLIAPLIVLPGPNPVVVFETSEGTIQVELLPGKAPATVENFLKYVKLKKFDKTLVFDIQGGTAFWGTFLPGYEPTPPIGAPEKKDPERDLSNDKGTLAMATVSEPDEKGGKKHRAEFFFNLKRNPSLDRPDVTVFGKVIEGKDILERISKAGGVPLPDRGIQNAPETPILIHSVRLVH